MCVRAPAKGPVCQSTIIIKGSCVSNRKGVFFGASVKERFVEVAVCESMRGVLKRCRWLCYMCVCTVPCRWVCTKEHGGVWAFCRQV